MKQTQSIEIPVRTRGTGKHNVCTFRKEKQVVGVIYGPKIGNIPFAADEKVLNRYKGHAFENTIFTLTSNEPKLNKVAVMFKGKDINPITRAITHVDFYALDLTQMIRVNVELRFTGKARGLADGGMLQAIAR